MPDVRLDAGDSAELAELLQFLAGWLARDPARPGASLEEFADSPAYNAGQLRQDLDRFIFLSAPTTAGPCSAPTRQSEAMTMASPLRGPKRTEGGGFAAAHLQARRAGYGAAPPAPGARKSGQAQAGPSDPRGAQPPCGGGSQEKQTERQNTKN